MALITKGKWECKREHEKPSPQRTKNKRKIIEHERLRKEKNEKNKHQNKNGKQRKKGKMRQKID